MRNSLYSVSIDEAFSSIAGRRNYELLLLLIGFFCLFTAAFSLSTLTLSHSPIPQIYLIPAAVAPISLSSFERFLSRKQSLIATAILGAIGGVLYSIGQHFIFVSIAIGVKGSVDACGSMLAILSVIENNDGVHRNLLLGGAVVGGYMGYGSGVMAGKCLRGEKVGLRFSGVIVAGLWVVCLPLVLKLRESPRYLAVVRGKYLQARRELQEIAAINKNPPFTDVLEGEKVIGFQECHKDAPDSPESQTSMQDSPSKLVFFPIEKGIVTVSQGDINHVKRFYPWSLLTLSSLRGLFATSVYTVCSLLLLLQTITNVPGSDLRWGKYALWAGDVSAVLAASLLVNATGRLGMSVVFLSAAGMSAALTSAAEISKCHSAALCLLLHVADVILEHLARGFARVELFVLVLFVGESFPTAVRFIGVSWVVGIAILFLVIVPSVVKMLPIDGVLFSGAGVCLGAIISCLLADTSSEELPDYVLEEQLEMQQPVDLSQIEIPQPAEDSAH